MDSLKPQKPSLSELIHKRIKQGQLPTISIAGHTFYADARNDLLRPKDDFMTMGIKFSDIDHYFDEEINAYVIPYNPKTHEFQEPDYDRITEYSKDLIVIKFPHERVLDPVGWNRRHGFEETSYLKNTDFKLHFKAEIVPWEKTILKEIITENRNRLKPEQATKPEKKMQKRGRKM